MVYEYYLELQIYFNDHASSILFLWSVSYVAYQKGGFLASGNGIVGGDNIIGIGW